MSGKARYLRDIVEYKDKLLKPKTKTEWKKPEPVRKHRYVPHKKPLALIR